MLQEVPAEVKRPETQQGEIIRYLPVFFVFTLDSVSRICRMFSNMRHCRYRVKKFSPLLILFKHGGKAFFDEFFDFSCGKIF